MEEEILSFEEFKKLQSNLKEAANSRRNVQSAYQSKRIVKSKPTKSLLNSLLDFFLN